MSREDWLDCPDPEGDRTEADERRDRELEKVPPPTGPRDYETTAVEAAARFEELHPGDIAGVGW